MFYGCDSIRRFTLNINGRLDLGEKFSLCCEPIENSPGAAFEGTAKSIIENFVKMRKGVIEESKKYGNNNAHGKRLYSSGCVNCGNYTLGDWDGDGLIHYINLSMYPAPCQCKCIYCDVHNGERGIFNRATCDENYELMFEALDYAHQIGLVAPNAYWQISTGEIAIHPYRERIYSLVENKPVVFYTNCFIFDERIAQILSVNPNSSINLSIDAGTPDTWFRIKGVNNFADITENLVRYYKSGTRPNQITLKYILLLGINNNMNDYQILIEIMKILNIKQLSISRDTSIKYNSTPEQLENLIVAAGYLLAMLAKNNMTACMSTFTPSEQKEVIDFANELLRLGKV